jgi:hypothetical protein
MSILILILILLFGTFGLGASTDEAASGPVEIATVAPPATEPAPDAGLGPDAAACFAEGQGVQVEVDGVIGTIVPEIMAWQWSTETGDDVSYFTPSIDDVTALESALAAEQTGIAEHHRQYIGYVENGERKFLIDAAVPDESLEAADGVTCADVEPVSVTIADGGEAFFEAIYNLDTGEVERFSFHGEA